MLLSSLISQFSILARIRSDLTNARSFLFTGTMNLGKLSIICAFGLLSVIVGTLIFFLIGALFLITILVSLPLILGGCIGKILSSTKRTSTMQDKENI